MSLSSTLRWLLLATACLASLFVVAYAAYGPFDQPFRAHTPLNGILFASLAALLLILFPRASPDPNPVPAPAPGPLWPLAAVCALTLLAFLPTLPFPFVSDGCTHVWWASQQSHSPLLSLLTSPQEGRFFRPVSFFSYYLNSSWAGLDPARWRFLNIALHTANTALLFFLGRRLGFTHRASLLAAFLFGLHATRPEAVVWVGAHFEVLTTLFFFLALLFWLREQRALALLCATLAFLSKESAYILPPLLTLLAFARRGPRPWLPAILSTWPSYLLAAAAFAWRWHLLQGIGGYIDPRSGALTILNFSPLHTAKALFLRIWTILTVPLNWSAPAEPWLVLALAAGLAALVFIAWQARAPRHTALALAAAVILCVLPSQHLALIGQALDGSRILYIASAPFCLLLALAASSAAPKLRPFLLCSFALLSLHAAALAHNLHIWGRVAHLAHHTVADTVRLIGPHAGPVGFRGVPNVVDGVYFIENGLPACVALQGGPPVHHLTLESPRTPIPPGALLLQWDPASRRIRRP